MENKQIVYVVQSIVYHVSATLEGIFLEKEKAFDFLNKIIEDNDAVEILEWDIATNEYKQIIETKS